MKRSLKNALKNAAAGIFIGVVNGAFGAGGGMLAVPYLKKQGLSQKAAQSNAVAVILPITVFSAAVYAFKGYAKFCDCLIFIPTGLLGAFLGTVIIRRISPTVLRIVFGAFMIYAGIRTVMF